jgi:epoxyqueuosine reductase
MPGASNGASCCPRLAVALHLAGAGSAWTGYDRSYARRGLPNRRRRRPGASGPMTPNWCAGSGPGDRNSALPRSASPASMSQRPPWLMRWLELGRHGEMDYMAKHAALRASAAGAAARRTFGDFGPPAVLADAVDAAQVLADTGSPTSRAMRSAATITRRCAAACRNSPTACVTKPRALAPAEPFACRVFSDSAPVLETEFARQSGIAWRGKHTLSLTRDRLVAFSRRDLHHPATARRPTDR